jgi:hypothetical protein
MRDPPQLTGGFSAIILTWNGMEWGGTDEPPMIRFDVEPSMIWSDEEPPMIRSDYIKMIEHTAITLFIYWRIW